MTQPLTPVSDCPLKRLEVQGDAKVRVYGVGTTATSLTLTIKHDRTESSDKLLLVVNAGLRTVMSITLSDLLSPGVGAITVARHFQAMTVRISQQGYEVRAFFDAGRDLELAAHTLSRLGFPVTEDAESTQSLLSDHFSAGFVPGPRLSSITLIPGIDTFGSASHDLAPSSPVNPASPGVSQAGTLDARIFGPQSAYAAPLTNHMQSETAVQRFSPYNLFASKQSELYRPPVGSPLRNSFSPDDAGSQRRHLSPVLDNWAQPPRSMSMSMASPSFPEPSSSFGSHGSYASSEASAGGGMPSAPSLEPQRNASVSSHESQDTMPERRDLPFVRAAATKSAVKPQRKKASTQRLPKPTESAERVRKRKQPVNKKQSQARVASRKNPARAAKMLSTPPSVVADQPGGGDGGFEPSPLEPATTVVVAEPSVVRRVCTMTFALLDQYEADVSRGCDKGLCVRFYLERLQGMRRDFWLRQLMGAAEHGRGPLAEPAMLCRATVLH
ncbi:hypothetical protein PLIIFM63780_007590 [Purpureocillium lilacinum]|uniref:Uncharacterized protein n=1 Tax=Purpureocillium lilacinum TaxID=33203 RepID=A0A179GY25_PURLI|nr:hypothetical protein VFPBJ_04784 [Purpureocillium lilacinum]GJN84037.1 hypothetical protein PLIIFM63780_007590 [Purpureocillium lilacinum]